MIKFKKGRREPGSRFLPINADLLTIKNRFV
jgi:hypothetical protein